ncbi:GFA family protein [Massilia atriviolacea]|uniref:GFA family protein n=1 Tax=Massilia atriviolacea TaxID=2495579 RepID=A0A430HTG4_9BURK|nr:GFA family protein [Massilia atriviolacea]RSZ60759.1 GFA family protein [Massilia atriviolacea]
MSLLGGCCCGAVRYETSDQVFHRTICHCPTCRRSCAAPHVAWFSVARADYRITAGRPAQWQSSRGVTRSFCGACGTQLSYARSDCPDEIDVTTCSLDDPEPLAPHDHTFDGYRLSWDRGDDGTPHYPGPRPQNE